jgi:hypothetical protein
LNELTIEEGSVLEELRSSEGLSDERTSQVKSPNGSGFTYFDTANQAAGVTLLVRATPAGSKA